MALENLKNNKIIKDRKLQILVFSFAIILTITLIYINSTSNILGHSYRDAYLYLIQSYKFSGHPISGYDYTEYLSPLIPFLTSILFRLGFISETSLFITTGIFYAIGIIGVYYLLKLRFNEIYSSFGAILYGSLSINLMWAGNGTLDIPSIALSIWGLYFLILAIEKNQRYFYLALPLGILSFFAKYTGALIFAIMLVYFISKHDIIENIRKYIKHAVGGVISSLILIIPFLVYYYIEKIPFGFITQAGEISSTTTTSAEAIAKHTGNQLFYYFLHIPEFVYSPQIIFGLIISIIGLIGIFYGLKNLITDTKEYYKRTDALLSLSFIPKIKLNKKYYFICLIGSIILIILSFLTAGMISFILSEAIFFISITLFSISFNSIFKDLNYRTFSYDITMISWFLGYMIFFSAHLTKVNRYFTAFAPGFVFLIIIGLIKLIDLIKTKTEKPKLYKIIPALFIIILLITTTSYLTIDKHDPLVDNEKEASLWIKENVPQHSQINIWAMRGPIYTWYLGEEVTYLTSFPQNQNLGDYLKSQNVSYYISTPYNNTINHFTKVKTIGQVNIYKNNEYNPE